jgi:hypothetical protein
MGRRVKVLPEIKIKIVEDYLGAAQNCYKCCK